MSVSCRSHVVSVKEARGSGAPSENSEGLSSSEVDDPGPGKGKAKPVSPTAPPPPLPGTRPPAVEGARGRGGGRGRGRGRGKKVDIQWGHWVINKLEPAGVHTGWGAVCKLHNNAEDVYTKTVCQKKCGFRGRKKTDEVYDDARCILQLKRWLLLGYDVPSDDIDSRVSHRDVNKLAGDIRGIGPVPGEDQDEPPDVPDNLKHKLL